VIEGRPPRVERMTGLSADHVDGLYRQLEAVLVWDPPLGRPRALPLYTAVVMVLFQLRHNLAEDACGTLGGRLSVRRGCWPPRWMPRSTYTRRRRYGCTQASSHAAI
jgi:hypothetical protein